MSRAVIFGAGLAGATAFEHLSRRQIEVIAFVDNATSKHGSQLNNIPVLNPNQLTSIVFDVIYIASEYFEVIQLQLESVLKIPKNKIHVLPANAIKNVSLTENSQARIFAEYLLGRVVKILNQEKINYYVDAGTLLGIIRDDALIPWDDDIDIALLHTDIESCRAALKSLLPELSSKSGHTWRVVDYKAPQSFGAVAAGDIRALKLMPASPDTKLPSLDVFVKYLANDSMDYVLSSRGFTMPAEHIKNTHWHTFNNIKLRVPGNVELYLQRHYGDWQTPKKDWHLGMLKNTTVFGVDQ